jgi:hypothetical protein
MAMENLSVKGTVTEQIPALCFEHYKTGAEAPGFAPVVFDSFILRICTGM